MSLLTDLPASCKILTGASGGKFTGSIYIGGRKAAVSFKVPWEDFDAFVKAVAGVPQLVGTGPSGTVTRTVPLVYPFAPKMYATSIDYEGVGADKTVSDTRPFPWVVATVGFETLPYNIEGPADQVYLTTRVQGSNSFVTIPNTNFTFVGNGSKSSQDVGRLVGEMAIQVTKNLVPDLDREFAVMLPLVGTVNSVPLVIGATTFAAGSILFPTIDTERQSTMLGQQQQMISISLMYRSIPWNSAVRSDNVVDALTPAPYPTSDHSIAFT